MKAIFYDDENDSDDDGHDDDYDDDDDDDDIHMYNFGPITIFIEVFTSAVQS